MSGWRELPWKCLGHFIGKLTLFLLDLKWGNTSQDQGRILETRVTIMVQLHFEKLRHFLKMNIFMKLLQLGTINVSISRRSVATATEKKNNNPLHQLKLSTCILRSCTVAEKVGSCNHISALMLKVSKCSLYKAKTTILLKEEN